MRRGGTLAAAMLAIALATGGCGPFGGGDTIAGYCSALQADRTRFADMIAADSPEALLRNLPMLRDLAGKAPDDIADDWQSLVTAVEGLQQALQQAHVSPSQFHSGRAPAGLSVADRKRIRVAADQLSASATVTASDNIDQEARDVCKINLGM